MNRTCLIRWLRIAVSAICVVIFCLFATLWVRSYSHSEFVRVNSSKLQREIHSVQGALFLCQFDQPNTTAKTKLEWGSHEVSDPELLRAELAIDGIDVGFGLRTLRSGYIMYMPHWFPIIFAGALGVIPWLSYLPRPRWQFRFSLRSLLILTTLVAVALALGIWLSK